MESWEGDFGLLFEVEDFDGEVGCCSWTCDECIATWWSRFHDCGLNGCGYDSVVKFRLLELKYG